MSGADTTGTGDMGMMCIGDMSNVGNMSVHAYVHAQAGSKELAVGDLGASQVSKQAVGIPTRLPGEERSEDDQVPAVLRVTPK